MKREIPAMTTADLASALSKHGVKLFKEFSGMTLNQVQRNLEGRTHYASDASLKFHKATVHTVNVMDDGLILGIVESVQKGPEASDGRGFRPVFFDVFGNTVYRPELDETLPSQKAAMAEFWQQADKVNAIKATIAGAKAKLKAMNTEVENFSKLVDEIEE